MSNAIVIFGSTTGVTEDVANRIASKIGTTAISVSDLNADVIAANDVLLLGSSTWGYGDLQDDWYDGVELLKTSKLTGKRVAVFGCGDSSSYSDTFCDAMSIIARAAVDGRFVGLAIDEINESDKTVGRIASWVATLGL